MFDAYFRKLIVFTCVFGILGLLIITYYFETVEVSVSDLLSINIKESVYIVTGEVKSIEIKSNTLFFSLCDLSNCISAVYFNPSSATVVQLKGAQSSNSLVKVKARFERYYGTPELVVYKIYFDTGVADYS